MADDFHTRLRATLANIPQPPKVRVVPAPELREPREPGSWTLPKQGTGHHADFLWRVFKREFPLPDDVRCAKQALRRCLQSGQSGSGLGWLIWDMFAAMGSAPSTKWSVAGDMRQLVRAHPPWLPPLTAEQRRRATRNRNRDQDTPVSQARVALMQSRIRQWISGCYGAPQSSKRWEALLRRTGASRSIRLRIMRRAVDQGLIPQITADMRAALERRHPAPDQVEEQARSLARRQRRWRKRAERVQQAQEQAWRQQRQLKAAQEQGYVEVAIAAGRLVTALQSGDGPSIAELQRALVAAENGRKRCCKM